MLYSVFWFLVFFLEEGVDGGSYDVGDAVCQKINFVVVGVIGSGIVAFMQVFFDIGKAQAFVLQSLDLIYDKEMFQGVTPLAASGAEGHDEPVERLFPEAQGVRGDF